MYKRINYEQLYNVKSNLGLNDLTVPETLKAHGRFANSRWIVLNR